MKGGEIVTDFEKLFRDYQDFIYKYLLRLTKSYTLAEEFTQETFFRAYMNRASLRNKEKVAVWLCQIAKNIYFSWYNEHKKMQPLDEVVGTEKVDAIEEAYVNKEHFERLIIYLHQLEEPYKEVFMLAVFGQVSLKEISQLFGKSESWARVSFYRAKQKLIEKMR